MFFFINCQNSDSLSPNQKDGRIVFGSNIDGIKIGDDSSTVISVLGKPDNVGIGDFPGVSFEYTVGEYAGMSIVIWTETGEGVKSVWVSNSYSGKTATLIGIGSTREELHQSYRQPDQVFDTDTGIYIYNKFQNKNRFIVRYSENKIVEIIMTSL